MTFTEQAIKEFEEKFFIKSGVMPVEIYVEVQLFLTDLLKRQKEAIVIEIFKLISCNKMVNTKLDQCIKAVNES